MKAKPVTFRPRADLAERIQKLAELSERSRTWIIEKCVEGHLAQLEQRYQQTGDIHTGNAPAPVVGRTEYRITPAAAALNEPKKPRK